MPQVICPSCNATVVESKRRPVVGHGDTEWYECPECGTTSEADEWGA